MNEIPRIVKFAQNYAAAWCSQHPEEVAAYFSENGTLTINGGEPCVGREAIADAARGFMAAFPDMAVTFDALMPTELGTEFHWTLTGTNTGSGGTGNHVKISGCEIWQIDADGLITESIGSFDAEEYAIQIANGVCG